MGRGRARRGVPGPEGPGHRYREAGTLPVGAGGGRDAGVTAAPAADAAPGGGEGEARGRSRRDGSLPSLQRRSWGTHAHVPAHRRAVPGTAVIRTAW
ncbi:hypothetical protein GCM10027294_53840 [Marinactinospora endophytica]